MMRSLLLPTSLDKVRVQAHLTTGATRSSICHVTTQLHLCSHGAAHWSQPYRTDSQRLGHKRTKGGIRVFETAPQGAVRVVSRVTQAAPKETMSPPFSGRRWSAEAQRGFGDVRVGVIDMPQREQHDIALRPPLGLAVLLRRHRFVPAAAAAPSCHRHLSRGHAPFRHRAVCVLTFCAWPFVSFQCQSQVQPRACGHQTALRGKIPGLRLCMQYILLNHCTV